MKFLRQITAVFVAMIFLVSSSGYMVYKTYCLCFGKEQVSIFVSPETCESEIHHHAELINSQQTTCVADECDGCTSHGHDCGCETPEAIFFKLQDQITHEEVKFVKVYPLQLLNPVSILEAVVDESPAFTRENFHSNPPPRHSSSLDFLISLQQLKIATIV